MKILYAIQGTGNGHVSRAREIIPILKKFGQVDLVLSGTQAEVGLEEEIRYRLHGFGFVFGKKGGVDLVKTWQEFNTVEFIKDARGLPVHSYDLIINDFEPVTAWACKLRGVDSVSLSHQSSFVSKKTPRIKGFHWGSLIMKNYAPTKQHIGFHFKPYDDFIYSPVIRSEIRNLESRDLGYYTVYLPAYSDEFILEKLQKIPQASWKVFSKHSKNQYRKGNVEVFPIDNKKFLDALASCTGLLTGGGFEGPAEALFLKKKVLCVPMRNQYEQLCNAYAIELLGAPVVWNEAEFLIKVEQWVNASQRIELDFPNQTEEIIKNLVEKYSKTLT